MSAVIQDIEVIPGGGVTSARGFRAGATAAGIRYETSRTDLAVVIADQPCVAHALFTQCQVVAAPVLVSRARIAGGRAQAIVINSGNANACTGSQGMRDAEEMADLAAQHLGIDPGLMLVESTGVIGLPMPMDRVRAGIARLAPTEDGGHEAELAIMTTDTVPKEYAVALEIAGRRVTIGGMIKGSGMIHPNMATMLAVLTTDAAVEPSVLREALTSAVDRSFNQVTVDQDPSTNDMVLVLASGTSGISPIQPNTVEARRFTEGLETVCVELGRMMARDGEGATRLVEVLVEGAANEQDARLMARSVVSSNLVKAAIYGRDPNWGRIIAAVGNAGVEIDPDAIDIFIGDTQVAANGAFALHDPTAVSEAMGADEVKIRVVLHAGQGQGTAWGCDLTENYVKINAEYTT